MGARQNMTQVVVSNGNDDQSVVSVSGYNGMFVRWMENDESKRCLVCRRSFRWWRRRHVSIMKGDKSVALSCLCSSCSPYRRELSSAGYQRPVRVCKMCNQNMK